MNRLTGFQRQGLAQGGSQAAKAAQVNGEIRYCTGTSTHTRIGCVDGLAVAIVEEGMPYLEVWQDLMACRTRLQIPSGKLLFTRRNSSALSDEALDQLACSAVSVADAGSRRPEDVQSELLDEFVQRQAQAMKVFKRA
ncbi:hypothetical protein [Aquabacterium sp.]|uniref:hypothetical protein n=1 Tax=Aquabacterium sp. TaxID=1872578 RepID=UPI004037F27D